MQVITIIRLVGGMLALGVIVNLLVLMAWPRHDDTIRSVAALCLIFQVWVIWPLVISRVGVYCLKQQMDQRNKTRGRRPRA